MPVGYLLSLILLTLLTLPLPLFSLILPVLPLLSLSALPRSFSSLSPALQLYISQLKLMGIVPYYAIAAIIIPLPSLFSQMFACFCITRLCINTSGFLFSTIFIKKFNLNLLQIFQKFK